MTVTAKQMFAASALKGFCEAAVSSGQLDRVGAQFAFDQLLAAFDEPPPRSRPQLVRVGDHDAEPLYAHELTLVANEMAVPS